MKPFFVKMQDFMQKNGDFLGQVATLILFFAVE